MKPKSFSLKETLEAFTHAIRGIKVFVINERNARLHLIATVMVVAAALIFQVSRLEASSLALVTGLVWVAEIINSCIEKTLDFITRERHPEIKVIKDMSAGAVLLASVIAFLVGLLIFIPKIIS